MDNAPSYLPMSIRSITKTHHDWDFKLLIDGTGFNSDQLALHEKQVVDELKRRAPARVLNMLPVYRPSAALTAVTAGGRTQTLSAWSRETGIPRSNIRRHLNQGCTAEQAVGMQPTPPHAHSADNLDRAFAATRVLILDGATPLTRRQAALRLGCAIETLNNRMTKYRGPEGVQVTIQLSELLEKSKKYRRN